MEIHRPKPLHGWRAFLGEVGIIVLGVLIALAAEQGAQAIEWRHKVHAAEEAMRLELAEDDGPQFYARAAMRGCVQGALDAIRAGVEGGADRAALIGLIQRYKTPFWTWDMLAYDAAVASGVPVHVPSKEMQRWTLAYSTVPAINAANAKEYTDGAELVALSHAGGALRPEERDRVLRAVELLRRDALTIDTVVRVTLPLMANTGVRIGPDWRRRMLKFVRSSYGAGCIETPPEPKESGLAVE